MDGRDDAHAAVAARTSPKKPVMRRSRPSDARAPMSMPATTTVPSGFTRSYQGALALCAPAGGGRLETDYIGNVRVLFDFYFPGVIPGDVLHVPEMEYSADSPVVKAIVAEYSISGTCRTSTGITPGK